MSPEVLTSIGSILASLGGLYYLFCTIKGTVQPNRVTWFFWGLFPMIAFAAQLSQGVGAVAWVTFFSGVTPILIVVASFFNPLAYWEIKRLDYVLATVALLGIILWQVTDNANLALTFSIIADLAAALPTVIKSYRFPGTESWRAYGLSAFGFAVALFAVQDWNYETAAFVVYLFASNFVLAVLGARK